MLTRIQLQGRHIAAASPGNIRVFGGIITDEFSTVIFDSLLIVVPAAALLILLFLLISYRDPLHLLGVIALVMAVIWTVGFTGLTGIAFSPLLVAIPPLLPTVGIDFGSHAINRYREERARDVGVDESMRVTLKQLLVAFFIAATTTVI